MIEIVKYIEPTCDIVEIIKPVYNFKANQKGVHIKIYVVSYPKEHVKAVNRGGGMTESEMQELAKQYTQKLLENI